MNGWWLTILISFGVVGGTLLFARWFFTGPQPVEKTERKEPPAQKYGHPVAPVPYLHDRLPKPPTNHMWEIKTELNEYQRPALTLSLLSTVSGVVASMSLDLVFVSTKCPSGNYLPSHQRFTEYYSEKRSTYNPSVFDELYGARVFAGEAYERSLDSPAT